MDEPPVWEGEAIGPFVKLRGDRIFLMDFGVAPTDAQLDAHCEAMKLWSEANLRALGGVVYLRRLLTGTAKQRQQLAELEKDLEAHDAKHVKACGIVAPNAITRGFVTAVFWLKPPVYPYRLFKTFEKALAWVEDEMRTV